jgi:aspartate carbamoyltransferase catalytic subunit
MALSSKDLLGIKGMTADEINLILDTAATFKDVSERDIKKVPALRGKTVINLFYEASTRTRTSFELAGKRLSADVINISTSTSSAVKGETLLDTARNIEAMKCNIIIVRHSCSGAPEFLSTRLTSSVINAGDGFHEHPTQALLDMFTIREKLGRLDGLNIAIVGDITHSRVARSNIYGLTTMGAKVLVCGPPTMMPPGIEGLGAKICSDMDEAIDGADAVMMLRLQLERQASGLFPGVREYARLYGMNSTRLSRARKHVIVMHPGPINRGVEIASDVADHSSVILDQVTNGVAVRMAVMFLLSGGGKAESEPHGERRRNVSN